MNLQAQPTKFYKSLYHQNRFKSHCKDDCIVAPIVPCDYIPFFVIEKGPSEFFEIVRFESKCLNGSDVVNIPTGRFYVCTFDGIDFIYHDSEFASNCINCGLRYYEIEDSLGNIWYSDLFHVHDFYFDQNKYYRMSWSNSKVINNIDYGAFNKFYYWFSVDTEIGVPEYRKEIQANKDGYGKEIRTFEMLEKYYLTETNNIPEYIVDAIELATMHDTISLNTPLSESYQIDKLETEVSWNKDGCYANTEIRFIIESCIIDTGCDQIKDLCLESKAKPILSGLDALSQNVIDSNPKSDKDTYLVISDDSSAGNQWADNVGSLAIWNESLLKWEFQPQPEGAYFSASINGYYYYLENGQGTRLFVIDNINYLGSGQAILSASIPENTWGQVMYSTGGGYVTLPTIYSKQEFESGITVGPLFTPSNYSFRLKVFNHNCNYVSQQLVSQSGVISFM